jgi:hypothetical protein
MSTATAAQLTDAAAQWRAARRIYPIYAALARQFELGPACKELAYPVDRSEPEVIAAVWKWFDDMDAKVQVHQLRQVLQTSHHVNEENLHALLTRHMERDPKFAGDRDKIDFLLVQYLAHQAPIDFHQRPVTLDEVAQVLEPVIGEVGAHAPDWLKPVNQALQQMEDCLTLGEFLDSGILAKVRKIKDDAGDMFYGSVALLTFTRFNFSVRGTFVHLIQEDTKSIRRAIAALEALGIKQIDASAAGFAAKEDLEQLKQICNDWKKHFRAEYAAGAPLRQIAATRAVVEAALANPKAFLPELPKAEAKPEPKAEAPKPAPLAAPQPKAAPREKPAAMPAPAAAPKPAPPAPVTKPVVPVPAAKAAPAPLKPAAIPQPVAKLAAKPAPKAAPAPEKKEAVPIYGVDNCLDVIAEQLLDPALKKNLAVAHVFVGSSKLLLASWEVAAFVQGGDDIADALQRAVAARATVLQATEARKRNEPVAEMKSIIAAAHVEAGFLQEQVSIAKDKKNIDAAVNLAATAKRLLSLLEEAEKLGA